MDKKELRKSVRAASSALSPAYRTAAGHRIFDHIIRSDAYRNSCTLFCYVSMDAEPDTRSLIECAWSDGKRVCVPKCLPDRQMAVIEVRSWSDFAPGMLGISEPVSCEPAVSPDEIDLVIVPCVSAAPDGSRLGHGGGYYDIFLEHCCGTKLCLCFASLLRENIPMTVQDIRMDLLATEDGLFDCTSSEKL